MTEKDVQRWITADDKARSVLRCEPLAGAACGGLYGEEEHSCPLEDAPLATSPTLLQCRLQDLLPSLRLSIEFKDRAALGVVLTGSEDWLRESKKR